MVLLRCTSLYFCMFAVQRAFSKLARPILLNFSQTAKLVVPRFCLGLGTGKHLYIQSFYGGTVFPVVSDLVSGSSGPFSSPGRDIMLGSCAKHFALPEPLPTQVYK